MFDVLCMTNCSHFSDRRYGTAGSSALKLDVVCTKLLRKTGSRGSVFENLCSSCGNSR